MTKDQEAACWRLHKQTIKSIEATPDLSEFNQQMVKISKLQIQTIEMVVGLIPALTARNN